jgi:hypothetical protein
MEEQPYRDKSKRPRSDSKVRLSGVAGCGERMPIGRATGRRLVGVALAMSLQLLGSACTTPQDTFTPLSDELVSALRSGGIRAAARLVHHYVGRIGIEDVDLVAPDAESLCRGSELVVFAKAISRSPGLFEDGDDFITTDYAMVVDEWLHGRRAAANTITVVMAGGFIQFPDGTTALERSGRGLPEIQIGSRYVLFLQRDQRKPESYRPFMREQGVFALDGRRVFSRGRDTHEVFRKYNGMKETDFLSLVRSATCK